MDSVHHIWCPLSSQEYQDLPDGAETTLTEKLFLELDDKEAMALAQFIKRLTWTEMRACAISDDETYLMKDAIDKLQKALSEEGYAPR